MDGTACTEAAIATTRGAVAMNHIKNNRLEYLVLMVFSHLLGATDFLLSKTSGVCS
jgi:hypothetical protein